MRILRNLRSIHGKTIQTVDTTSCNVVVLRFTDGSAVTLEGVHAGFGLHGFEFYDGDCHEENETKRTTVTKITKVSG